VTLVRDTVRGAIWTIGTGMGARGLGLVGTLVVTHFIAPGEYGEVMIAAVLAMTANQISTLGLGQYIVAHPHAERGLAFHATVLHVVLGILALGALMAVGDSFGPLLDAPGLIRFLPGLAVAAVFDRVAFVPERVLIRDLRFGAVSGIRTAGDVAHTLASVGFAAAGWGGMAIVFGNLARSVLRLVLFVAAVKRDDWLEPHPLSWTKARELLAFGVPIAVGGLGSFAARRWDNLLVSRFFGPGVAGMYNLAYNLADVPAIQVGEQVGDVLLPSFARLERDRRPAALVRSLSLLSLIVFPLAVGLGVVAPTLVRSVFDERWQAVAPMLVVLAAIGVARPIGWTVASYLQARKLPRWLMWLELAKLALLVLALVTLGRASPLAACAVVAFVYAAHALASLAVIRWVDGVALSRSLGALAAPLLSCALMVVAVLTVRQAFAPLHERAALQLAVEVGVGALAYVASAFAVARRPSRDLVARLREALRVEARQH
jgi:lipopolysaccharide exporter